MDDSKSFVKKLKTSLWRLIGTNCQQGLKTFNLRLLDNIFDDLDLLGAILLLSSYPYEQFKFIFKHSYASSSKRLKKRIGDTLTKLDRS